MYEYAPKPKRRREKLILALSLIFGALSFAFSLFEWMLYPAVCQLAAVGFFTVSVVMLSRYLLRDYVYRVEPRGWDEDGPLDLTVTEIYGKRRQVVCRVALSDIRESVRVNAENRKSLAKATKGKRLFVYTPEMGDGEAVLLTVSDGDTQYFVKICADEGLFSALLIG